MSIIPVLIKYNQAVELNVTNGAEGTVVGWQSYPIGDNKFALDTVFILLTNPPSSVQLDGLPLNVVPISKQKVSITAVTPSGKPCLLSREQVPILLNFAMTIHCSQGHTRSVNLVDLKLAQSGQAVYTALSRAFTLKCTVILCMPPL